jgi:uncharacterized protein
MAWAAAPDRRPLGLAIVLVVSAVGAGLALAALTFPALTGRVVDEAGLLTAAESRSLTEMLEAHERATTNQVVVVTLKSLQGTSIEDYGYQLGRHWGIGQKGKDNGALLIVAPNERKVRIEVGYGLEGELTDAASKLIIENIIVPAFKAGQFGPGIVAGTGAILKVLGGEELVVPAKRREAERETGGLPLLPMLFVGLFWLLAMRGRSGRRGGVYPIFFPGGGGRGGGGFGGGGFSGGGGGFGGGGASGSW